MAVRSTFWQFILTEDPCHARPELGPRCGPTPCGLCCLATAARARAVAGRLDAGMSAVNDLEGCTHPPLPPSLGILGPGSLSKA